MTIYRRGQIFANIFRHLSDKGPIFGIYNVVAEVDVSQW
jgi:hypothetical protein